jgi:hypothetical protein
VNIKLVWIALIIALISFVGLASETAWAQTADVGAHFSRTGHWVSGEFLEKYNHVPNAKQIYGDPITDAFEDAATGTVVQYFEKARFELDPDASFGLRVKLTALGELLYKAGEAVTIPAGFPTCRNFQETDKPVCYAFLDFFEANGGVTQFGYPISGFEIHGGWYSQYFQHARLEWHPERDAGDRVVVADLGVEYFQFLDEDPILLQPQIENNLSPLPEGVSELQVQSFVSKPFLPILGEQQELYVMVYDQNFKPLENVIISYVIIAPGETDESVVMPPTNNLGLSIQELNLNGKNIGTVKIVVTATYGTLQVQSRTSFQIW